MKKYPTPVLWLKAPLAAAMLCFVTLLIAGYPAQLTQGQQSQPNQEAQAKAASGGGQTQGQVLGPAGEVWGFSNLAEIPGTPWRIHDANRPQPRVVSAGDAPGAAPSDAIVLFDGKDLSKWALRSRDGAISDAPWAVHDGIFESGRAGSISTREKFGDIQLHIEFATPVKVVGNSQGRGNSGVIFMGRYEIQVLDSYNNRTYADGMAASIYGEWPPLINVARKPGEWQTYDIMFHGPRVGADGKVQPGSLTVLHNGVLVQDHVPVKGDATTAAMFKSVTPKGPLVLQDHGNPVRYRNIWLRPL